MRLLISLTLALIANFCPATAEIRLPEGSTDSSHIDISPGDTISYSLPVTDISINSFEIKVAPAKSAVDFQVSLTALNAPNLSIDISTDRNNHNDFDNAPRMLVTARLGQSIIANNIPVKYELNERQPVTLRIVSDGTSTEILVGASHLHSIASIDVGDFYSQASITPIRQSTILRSTIAWQPAGLFQFSDFSSETEIIDAVNSRYDPYAAIWTHFDYTTDPSKAAIGGRYRIATVARYDGSYDIIYLGGATSNQSRWQPLMIKGSLTPTPIPGVFDITWIDSSGHQLYDDLSATFDNNLLTLSFPHLSATIRFARN